MKKKCPKILIVQPTGAGKRVYPYPNPAHIVVMGGASLHTHTQTHLLRLGR